ncbi:hypothetical protein CHS0354_038990 [Potamilus streckersoni]|uniref:Uncharacterized protein n=1 Tax=Potamilus streckersoni TaxID=2493646 RepID=A0AAE0S198_9BIVA|nr:hypothetical protein CHS0354_038990 [Potamilus streckersoni]
MAFDLDHEHKETGSTRGADVPSPAKQTKIDEQFIKPIERMSATKQKEIDDVLLKIIVGKVLQLGLVDNILGTFYEIPGRKQYPQN